ncbi:hypothetical protein AUK40_05835 [Candidatus Wirthbacteria bacterium CG2_30_54_11]|uniref:DUF2007 domain-containing protein n=1 Tax=Candidatus Wirthbacteria bacterium CG2_30_54_11 TaxID=1817892 RepID=A0A1J5IG17_9BACT|nr:MAG: hypothetical protein AUK40_05835 [Candidatus Wirthbacteria bacterium CG2_30_54_11]
MADEPLVSICSTPDIALLALARATLDEVGIKYMVKGEQLQNVLGLGTLGMGYNPIAGPAEIFILAKNAKQAHELIDPLFTS